MRPEECSLPSLEALVATELAVQARGVVKQFGAGLAVDSDPLVSPGAAMFADCHWVGRNHDAKCRCRCRDCRQESLALVSGQSKRPA